MWEYCLTSLGPRNLAPVDRAYKVADGIGVYVRSGRIIWSISSRANAQARRRWRQ